MINIDPVYLQQFNSAVSHADETEIGRIVLLSIKAQKGAFEHQPDHRHEAITFLEENLTFYTSLFPSDGRIQKIIEAAKAFINEPIVNVGSMAYASIIATHVHNDSKMASKDCPAEHDEKYWCAEGIAEITEICVKPRMDMNEYKAAIEWFCAFSKR